MTKDQIPQMQLIEKGKETLLIGPDSRPVATTPTQKRGNQEDVVAVTPEPSVALMLQGVIEKGITADNVSALESLVSLYERMRSNQAEKDFAVAFNRLMAEMPPIQATKPVPNNDGTVRYRFAPLEEIEAIVRPVALRNGFSYSFSEGPYEPGRVTKVCTVQHSSGHKRVHQFTVRTSAPPKANDSQADGSTHSYAKRGAFSDAFSIIVDHDDDARILGKPIGKAIAEDLLNRVKLTGSDMISFLKFAGVTLPPKAEIENYDPIEFFEQIPDERFEQLDEILKRKEARSI